MRLKKKNYPHLTERESELMAMLWNCGPMFVKEMVEKMDDPKPHFNTVSTTVRILEDKGYVGHEVIGGSHKYHAIARSSDFAGKSMAQIIKNFFSGSATAAVSALVEEEQLSVEELKELIDLIEKKK